MSRLLDLLPVLVAVLGGIGFTLHALAAYLKSRNPELAARLEASEHLIECLALTGEKHAHGESFFQAALEAVQSPDAQALASSLLERVRAAKTPSRADSVPGQLAPSPRSSATPPSALLIAAAFGVSIAFSSCSAAQIQADEAAIHSALVKVREGVDWASANPEALGAALDEAAKAAPNDPTLQKIVAKAKAGIAAGDLSTAQLVISGGIALTAPVTSAR